MTYPLLSATRIFIAEDEALIALLLESILQDAGCEVIGPFGKIEHGVDAAQKEPMLDAALLDVNLGRDGAVFPIADELTLRNIPIVFITGYGAEDLPERYRDYPVVSKPYTSQMITDALRQALMATAGQTIVDAA